jgi:arsenate reductase (glutaredoxin)
MNKVYYLSTCSTCIRIIAELKLKERGFSFQDIKSEKLSGAQLEELKNLASSYEALFSRVALKYKNLNPKPQSEEAYAELILQEYTFLKRPVILYNRTIFIGNSKNNVAKLAAALEAAD